MSSKDIRQKFLEFFEKSGHKVVPSSSLIPTDPSVLLTTAGMQQFKPYFVGTADPMQDFGSKNTASIQKCFRTSDIDEVGDETHLTFFEMLGNFSFGGYFKEEAIKYAHEFITQELGLKIDYVSVFEGDSEVPKDVESEKIWRSLGVNEIKYAGRADNFWGPTGAEGPCGPTTEIYVNGVEIWNIVFNEYYMHADLPAGASAKEGKSLEPLKQKGVDTGMGLERLAMVTQNKPTIFETDLFSPLLEKIPDLEIKKQRVVADHARGIIFLLGDGVRPSNKEAGYILRRLMRRVFVYENLHKFRPDFLEELIKVVIENYSHFYPELKENRNEIINEMWMEHERFAKTVSHGLKELEKQTAINAKVAFHLYESFGLPYEVIKEMGAKRAEKLNREEFDEEFKKHQEISRAGMEKKFGGHGLILNTGELKAGSEEELNKVLRLHTATHLLQRALREVLGPEVKQAGSDITAERTRFDFNFSRKLTPEEIKKVEDLVNEKIKEDLPVNFKEMPKEEAEKTGALFFFKEKYPDKVKVYYIGKSLDSAWSKEFCGGPHVNHTGVIGKFKIAKEESIGANTRRIRATVN
ncbi:MAG: alanine--tRNA ligase [Candidatus Liptonbacteria bacterium]|nr:alanine--tRNA ligase [Candidatus Liptonbacteria bacterium]